VKKKTGPAVTIIKSAADVDALLESEDPVAVAYLSSVEGADADEFTAVARLEDGVEFHMTADEQIAKKLGLVTNAPALVLLKKQDEKVSTFGMHHIILWFYHNKFVLAVMAWSLY
jgi:protein disulfide-isomerase A1